MGRKQQPHCQIKGDGNGNVIYDCVWFGRYPQSDATGVKKEAIKWRVLSVYGNDAFLIADCNLDCQPYNTTRTDVTWETSTIRSWLNGYNAGYIMQTELITVPITLSTKPLQAQSRMQSIR